MRGCDDRHDALMDVALGLPATPELERHLLACESCRAALNDLRDTAHAVDCEVARLAAEPVPAFARKPRGLVVWAVAAVACALVVFVVWPRPQPVPDVSALSSWQSPTAGLLPPLKIGEIHVP